MEVYFKTDSARISNFVTELKNTEGNALVSLYTGMAQAICFFVEKRKESELDLNQILEKISDGQLSVFLKTELLKKITTDLVRFRVVFSNSKNLNDVLASENGLSAALAVDWASVLAHQDKFYSGYQFVSDSLRIVIDFKEL